MKDISKTVLVYILTGVFVLGPLTNVSRAEDISLSVFPPLIELNKNDSDDISAEVTLKNSGDSTLGIKVLLRPFRALDEDGSIEIIPENQVPIPYKNLFSDIKIIDNGLEVRELQLAPEQTKNLEINISSNVNPGSGDYYFTVIFLAESDAASLEATSTEDEAGTDEIVSGNSIIEAGIGVNVILSASKDLVPEAEITEFSAPGTAESGPVSFRVRVKNKSAKIIKPKGIILIRNMFGQTVGRVDLRQTNILSGSIRSLPDTGHASRHSTGSGDNGSAAAVWPEEFLMGLYSADLSLALSDDGPVLNKTTYFVGLPVVTVIIFSISIGFIIFVIFRINHYLRRKK